MHVTRICNIEEITIKFDDDTEARFNYDKEWIRCPSHPGGSGGFKYARDMANEFYDRCNSNVNADRLGHLIAISLRCNF